MEELYAAAWNDAHGSDGTLHAHEVDHKPYMYTTVGFLIKSDEVGVSIAFERGEDGRYRGITFIPRAIVVEEYSLGPLKRPRKRAIRPKSPLPPPP